MMGQVKHLMKKGRGRGEAIVYNGYYLSNTTSTPPPLPPLRSVQAQSVKNKRSLRMKLFYVCKFELYRFTTKSSKLPVSQKKYLLIG